MTQNVREHLFRTSNPQRTKMGAIAANSLCCAFPLYAWFTIIYRDC